MALVVAIALTPIKHGERVLTGHVRVLKAGLEGDRRVHRKERDLDNGRDVTFISQEAVERSTFTHLETRRNVLVCGVEDLQSLIGKRFQIGTAIFQGTGYCDPCINPANLLSRPKDDFIDEFTETAGLNTRIEQEGEFSVGDEIAFLPDT